MIRHALAPAACPVGPVAVAVIVPSLRAFLVFPLGGPNLLPARFAPAAETAVFVAPVTMTADPEHPATVRTPAKPLTQWLFTGPHRRASGGPEQPRRSMASVVLSISGGSVGSFGPAQKARWAANGRGSPRPASAPSYQCLGADDGSIPHCRRPSQCRSARRALSVRWPLTRDGCLHGLGGGAVGATDNSRSCPSCPLNRIIPAAVWPG